VAAAIWRAGAGEATVKLLFMERLRIPVLITER
jgi:hypothetical protein